MKSFQELNINKALMNALTDLKLEQATAIQEACYSKVLSGRDLVGIAQTGTGKTYAYLLPLLNKLKYSKQTTPRVLIMVPTRELVVQVVKDLEQLTEYMTVRTIGVYGGVNIRTQSELFKDGADILVATPGRLVDLTLNRVIRLKDIQYFVIDEMDEMLNLGFRSQLIDTMDLLPKRRQNLLFSATVSKEVESFINDFFEEPDVVQVAAVGSVVEAIEQSGYKVPNFYTKVNLLKLLMVDSDEFTKVLIFVGNKKRADMIHEHLLKVCRDEFGTIHSNKSQNYRLRAVEKFTSGEHRILITTDLLARGLDVEDVSHVVNFDMPEMPEHYVHRVGRTGRAGKTGKAISFITNEERIMQEQIEQLMQQKIEILDNPEYLMIESRLTPDEKERSKGDKNYLQEHKLKDTKGAFHDKKEKNKKINLGNAYWRKMADKYKKPKKRR